MSPKVKNIINSVSKCGGKYEHIHRVCLKTLNPMDTVSTQSATSGVASSSAFAVIGALHMGVCVCAFMGSNALQSV